MTHSHDHRRIAHQKMIEQQESRIAEGHRQHAKEEVKWTDTIQEGLSRTIREKFDTADRKELFGKTTFVGIGGYERKPSPWISSCCKAEAMNYRTTVYRGDTERFFRCKECYEECEVTKKCPPSRRKGG